MNETKSNSKTSGNRVVRWFRRCSLAVRQAISSLLLTTAILVFFTLLLVAISAFALSVIVYLSVTAIGFVVGVFVALPIFFITPYDVRTLVEAASKYVEQLE